MDYVAKRKELMQIMDLWILHEDQIGDQRKRKNLLTKNLNKYESPSVRKEISKIIKIVKSLSSTHRLLILISINETVLLNSELEYILCASQSKINHHVRKLADAGLINIERRGKINILSITRLGKITAKFLLDYKG